MYKKTINLILKYFIIVYYKQLHIKNFMSVAINSWSISFPCVILELFLPI